MDRADAIARVSLLGATDKRPALTAAEVATIVDAHSIADTVGRAPTDPSWAGAWEVNGAVAEVWRIKAGRVAADFNFAADDARYDKGDVLAHCLAMEAKYASMVGSATGFGSGNAGTIQVGGTNGPFSTLDRIAERIIP